MFCWDINARRRRSLSRSRRTRASAVSRPSCCKQKRTLAVINWRRSSVELSRHHLRQFMCLAKRADKFTIWGKVPKIFEDTRILFEQHRICRDSLCAQNQPDPFSRFDGTSTCDRSTPGHGIYRKGKEWKSVYIAPFI